MRAETPQIKGAVMGHADAMPPAAAWGQSGWGQPLADFSSLKDFVYLPYTNWQGLFGQWFSPHITFGTNIEDRPVETKILDTVGSYGSQINRIMDAVSVLAAHLNSGELTPREQFSISKFNELALLADRAATELQGKPSQDDVTGAEVARWLDGIDDIKQTHPAAYARIAAVIMSRLGDRVKQP